MPVLVRTDCAATLRIDCAATVTIDCVATVGNGCAATVRNGCAATVRTDCVATVRIDCVATVRIAQDHASDFSTASVTSCRIRCCKSWENVTRKMTCSQVLYQQKETDKKMQKILSCEVCWI